MSSERRRLGDYEVLHQLSAGGMGEVLLARKRGAGGFERLAAIKTIRSDLRAMEQLRAMFLDEAKLLSRLSHPAVAQVYDFGEQDGMLYLVMEYVAGVSFGDLMDLAPLPPGIASRLVAQGCRGLHAAHTLEDEAGNPLGVVHRDVSPDNLMLTFGGAVQVLDFGIALMRGRSAPVTDFGTVKGKPPYLSPEQVRGEAIDRRSDVFSATVVLWELLCDQHLFAGDSIYAIGQAVLDKDIPAPSSLNPEVPAELDAVVAQGLARDPDERFQTAQALAEALDALAASMKAESLGVYASRELARAKDQHREWLAEIKDGEVKALAGRPSHVMTAQGDVDALFDEQRGEPGDATVDDVEDEPQAAAAAPPRGRLLPALLLAVLACAVVLGIAWLKMRGGERVAGAELDAAVSDAAPIADATPAASVVDAGGGRADAAPPADAASTVDASARVVGRGRPDARPRRPRPDARPRRPARPDAAAQPAGHGFITVVADPFASVRIDGRSVGNTPLFNHRVRAGRHTVELFTPDSGALRHRKVIEVSADQRIRVRAPR